MSCGAFVDLPAVEPLAVVMAAALAVVPQGLGPNRLLSGLAAGAGTYLLAMFLLIASMALIAYEGCIGATVRGQDDELLRVPPNKPSLAGGWFTSRMLRDPRRIGLGT